MGKTYTIIISIILGLYLAVACIGEESSTIIDSKYFGQEPPNLKPKKFAPGLVSTSANELNCVFTPDGNECFFTVGQGKINTIMSIKRVDGQLTKRTVATFSGNFSDVDPYITSDGNKLYFSSKRPIDKNGKAKDSDLWYVEKLANNTWGNPTHLGNLNSKSDDDYYTSIAKNGTIYYSKFKSGSGTGDIYKTSVTEKGYSKPEKLPNPINTDYSEHDPFIAQDESYIIFTSNRPGGYGRGDLYICFMMSNGKWSDAMNLGEEINSEGYDFCPIISHDGEFLFFTRNVGGNGDIYWVNSKIIDDIKKQLSFNK